jgi:catechol 2,3-dioxygenase-like lactoylglutathione lyase family enzyme
VSARVWSQPLVVVRDVPRARDFYCAVLGAESGHGGDEYEQIVDGGEIVLQLHRLDVDDHHGRLADESVPLGNGVLLWFEVADLERAAERAREHGAEVERDVHHNPNAKHDELWLRDPDGYRVVVAGPSEYHPRSG